VRTPDVGVLEVVALVEQRFITVDRERVCKTVAKIETGRMASAPSEIPICSAGDAGLGFRDVGELDLARYEIPVKLFAGSSGRMSVQHDCSLEVICNRQRRSNGATKHVIEFLSVRLTSQDGNQS
jgi:hypothetical protein